MSQTTDGSDVVLKEGQCIKKSGNRGLLGKYNWQKRWFVLIQRDKTVTLYYYEKRGARVPKGEIQLSNKYVTREPEGIEKERRNCFEVGPFAEDGTTRTYYICCETEDDKHEWMEVLDAAIEGTTAKKALLRKQTASFKAKKRKDRESKNSLIAKENEARRDMYLSADWRKQQWANLLALAIGKNWKKADTKDGVTVSRMSFSDLPLAVIKVEGLINARSKHVYSFLQTAIQPGGKLDFPFRGMEDILDEFTSPPRGSVMDCYKEIKILPNTKPRGVTLLQAAVPLQLTQGESCGILIMSVNHPDSHKRQDAVTCNVGLSGCIIKPKRSLQTNPAPTHNPPPGDQESSASEDDEDDLMSPGRRVRGSEVTHLTLLGQINLQGSLQTMLKGAYKSGLLVHGMRSFFQNLTEHINSYVKIVDV
ncbi:uncharacterized protein LOC119737636 isoform X2 [Patiria miniata]|uniref:PH domain-containing protein n=1 Tax=Patiria miniata TaxID=46514 RepID=A0A914AWY5_PATMI|nr:uncharacterized protein LOC119737636 isoform X2 [Patiria miniata]